MATRILLGEDPADLPTGIEYLPEVRRQPMVRRDRRATDDPAKLRSYGFKTDWWYNNGKNHRVEDGQIVRDFEATGLFIEVENFEALAQLLRLNPTFYLRYDKVYEELCVNERD